MRRGVSPIQRGSPSLRWVCYWAFRSARTKLSHLQLPCLRPEQPGLRGDLLGPQEINRSSDVASVDAALPEQPQPVGAMGTGSVRGLGGRVPALQWLAQQCQDGQFGTSAICKSQLGTWCIICISFCILDNCHLLIYMYICICMYVWFFFFFFFCSTGVLTQGLHLEPLHQPFFVMSFFEIGSLELFAQAGFEPWSS
jgi:hypothetical protein